MCPTCGEETMVPMSDAFNAVGEASPPEHPTEAKPLPPLPPLPATSVAHSSAQNNELNERREVDDEPDDWTNQDSIKRDTGETDAVLPHTVGFEDVNDSDESEKPPLALRRRRFTEEEMDLTPMVDVTFQLLIFFMVTASFALQKSIQVPTPDPDQQGATQQMQTLNDIQATSIIVKIDASNGITIDDEPLVDPKQLNEVLSTKMRREQKTELLLSAHTLAMHRTVISVIDAANDVGMQKIRMTSRKRDMD